MRVKGKGSRRLLAYLLGRGRKEISGSGLSFLARLAKRFWRCLGGGSVGDSRMIYFIFEVFA
jgi:hypothetical protein